MPDTAATFRAAVQTALTRKGEDVADAILAELRGLGIGLIEDEKILALRGFALNIDRLVAPRPEPAGPVIPPRARVVTLPPGFGESSTYADDLRGAGRGHLLREGR